MGNKYNIAFNTDGWRGLLDSEVNMKSMAAVAQAFASYLITACVGKERIKAAVGFDGRRESKKFATLFARVLSGNGIVVLLSDKIGPTPILSYYIKANKLDAGVMITASHNPWNYNGVKFKASYGGPFFSEEIKKIESLIGQELVQASDEEIHQVDFREQYVKHVEHLIDFEAIRNSDIKIIIDSMSGAGQQVVENILFRNDIRSRTICMIAEYESDRLAEPVEQNLAPLKEELKKGDYSFGVATDGDADRIGVMMENGEWLSSQEGILLLADYIINKKKFQGNVLKTAPVTDKLKLVFETSGRIVKDVQPGFKNIHEMMLTEDTAFGAEESGGFAFKNHLPERDGILAGLFFIEMLAKSGHKKLSELVKEKRKFFGNIFYKRIDFEYDIESRLTKISGLASNPPETIGNYKVSSFRIYESLRNVVSSIKFTFDGDSRWLLIRASETEPLTRIYAEGNSDEEVNLFLSEGKKFFD